MKKTLTIFAAIVLSCLMAANVSAQGGYTVKSVVVDKVGPVVGAYVIEQGTTNGVSTDLDGQFTLSVASADATVEISCIGYTTTSFKASQMPAQITLAEDNQFLDEVVVIGYGTVKKGDMTGSISAVKPDLLNKGAITSPADLLKGKSAGVVVVPGSGMPGSGSTIRIRGGSSLSATNDPLIIIDGLAVSNDGISGGADPLSTINPNDIESFTVLKDASATAIYGSRASNGVIVITTKKGSKYSSKVPQVTADFAASVSSPSKYVDVMSADEIRNAIRTIHGEDSDPYRALGNANTNWQKEIYQLAQTYDGNVSVGGKAGFGAAGFMPYRVSGGYTSQEGILKTGKMERATASVNLTPTFLDEHLTVALNGKYSFTHNRFANTDAIGHAFHFDPTKPIYDADGVHGYTTWYDAAGNVNTMATRNPIALLDEKKDLSNVNRFIGNAQLDYKIHGLEDLRININAGLDWAKSNGTVDVPTGAIESICNTQQSGSGYHTDYNYLRRDETFEAYLAYSHDFKGNHHFDAMAGYSWQHFYNESTNYQFKLTTGDALSDVINKTEYYLVSFFGRLNYSFDDRYLITATIRRDGTSRFSNNQWGLFPSVALGWNLKNEPWLKNSKSLSALKIRLSWGQTGQQDLNAGNYPTLATYYTNLLGSHYIFNGQEITPITALGYNADLKWETTTTYNAGIDFGFFDGRLNGGLDVYYRKTTDLINLIPVAALANLTNYLTSNIGDLENRGIEFELNAIPVSTKDWEWSIGGNIAYNKNEITKLTASPDDKTGIQTGNISGGTGNTIQMHQVGFPASSFYVYQQVYDNDGNPIAGVYVDRNGNGITDEDDRYFYNKPSADYTFGLNTTLTWRNLSLAAAGHGSWGNWMYNNVQSENEKLADLWTNSFVSNRVNSALATGFNSGQFYSDYYVQDASFFKIDNVTLSYRFPKLFTGAGRNANLTIYGTVQNCYTFTKYTGVDPEVYGGIDGNIYPRPRTYLLGLKFNF